MNEPDLRARVVGVIRSVAPEVGADELVADRPLREQIDLDSMDFLNVIVRLHEVLGIDIPEQDYAELLTLNSTIKYLAARGVRPA